MSNYRGLIWSLVAIAGTATAAGLTYRYVTRRSRTRAHTRATEEEEATAVSHATGTNQPNAQGLIQRTGDGTSGTLTAGATGGGTIIQQNTSEVIDSEVQTTDMQRLQQQLVLVPREGNLVIFIEKNYFPPPPPNKTIKKRIIKMVVN